MPTPTYIVCLTDDERQVCLAVVKKLRGSSQKVRRANILLKADVEGPNWTDQAIADAFFCTRQCAENIRKPVQLFQETRQPIPATVNHAKRVDYEYDRAGVANVFIFAEGRNL